MLKEITFRVELTPAAERALDDLHEYSRWAESLEAFTEDRWRLLAA